MSRPVERQESQNPQNQDNNLKSVEDQSPIELRDRTMATKKTARFLVANVDSPLDQGRLEDKVDSHHNSVTHMGTLYLKSLRNYLTREALPNEHNYRNILSLSGKTSDRKFVRPTLDELNQKTEDQHEDAIVQNELGAAEEVVGEVSHEKIIKFGWFKGVFLKCLLNIWGVMLFLRLSWVVGQCGILQGLTVIFVCNLVTIITTFSMSAVSTNGIIKGGGIYYMISRSLGPEFGGAIGIMFTIANSIAVATYLIGFCDSLIDMIHEYNPDFTGIVGSIENRENDIRIIGAGTLVLIFGIAIGGMKWVTRVEILLLVILVGSQIDFIVGSFLPAESEKKFGFVGYSLDLLQENFLKTNYHPSSPDGKKIAGFFDVFGVFFPACTGIVAGANMSGDLKDPGMAIPKGTLIAIAMTFISYMGYAFIVGATFLSEASGVQAEYDLFVAAGNGTNLFENGPSPFENGTGLYYNDCIDRVCKFGSSNDQQTFSKISYTGFLVYAGCFAATLSSAIASLCGAPRVLQALAKDKLFPFISIFAKPYGKNKDPLFGYVLVFFIAFGCTMLGNLDVVSTLLSNFFVAAYALINFSVFLSSFSKSPGWRPSFKYYNQWVSLAGTVLCIAVMVLMDWVTAIITILSVVVLYFYISYRKPDANWGSSTHSQQFMTTLKNLQSLNEIPDHVKTYRPKILIFTGLPQHRVPLLDFGYLLTKKHSLLMSVDVIEDLETVISKREKANTWMKESQVKGFFHAVKSNSFDNGAISAMSLFGIGKLSPNMIMLGYKSNWTENLERTTQYINVLHNAFELHLGVGILRLPMGCNVSAQEKENEVQESLGVFKKKRKGNIDVWWLYDDGGLTMLLPYILTTRSQFSGCKLRIFVLANRNHELDLEARNMASLMAKFRIDFSDVTVIPDVTDSASPKTHSDFLKLVGKEATDPEVVAHAQKTNLHLRISELLREHSLQSDLIVTTLPMPRKSSTSPVMYMSWLEMITRDMPPFLLVRGNQSSVLTFYS